ncbi:glycoside hydrolase family 97 protein [Marinilabiliaceae bacterium JC017]|nr:glycoside hydrolase family 97 protein [Marinilabiliaceae bacterium JC017]
MKHTLFTLLLLSFSALGLQAKDYKVTSPDKKLEVTIASDKTTSWQVRLNGQEIIAPSSISMKLDNGITLGNKGRIKKVKTSRFYEEITPVVPRKYNKIKNECNEMVLSFSQGYQLIIRAYNEGAAYRWKTNFKKEVKVISEEASFLFSANYKIWFPEETSMYSHQERQYPYLNLSDITPDRFCSTGTLVDLLDGHKVYISEADLEKYPGMFLKGAAQGFGLNGKFAGYPLETNQTSDRDVVVTKYADYLAVTSGKRVFPWRLIIISKNDTELVASELIYKLSKPLQIKDPSWIKPGKVAWDWWNNLNISGVDFEAGVNTATYKYFIDFASQYGIEYIILDEGWYHLEDVLKIKEEVDVHEIIRYGKEKNVDVILWVTWKALDDKLDEALTAFEQWSVKGIKVDFMQRDDQWMVNYYHRIAKKAAEHKLLVNYHGAYKPTGLRRAYPNVITREGIFGMEQNKWTDKKTPEHNVTLPFIRMVAGPMDFTPGAMLNGTKKNFRAVWDKPMGQGTRCHQLAMYVVYESPLQMLADNPTHYYNEPECMEFLSPVPSVWDDTKVLDGKVGDYILMARKSGNNWFLGAMTDWDPRELTIDFSFLEEGSYTLTLWQDGANAHRSASDYKKMSQTVTKNTKLKINLAPGGGWVGILEKK